MSRAAPVIKPSRWSRVLCASVLAAGVASTTTSCSYTHTVTQRTVRGKPTITEVPHGKGSGALSVSGKVITRDPARGAAIAEPFEFNTQVRR